jgi:hypothetical protein
MRSHYVKICCMCLHWAYVHFLFVCPVWQWMANGTVRAQRACNLLLLENNALKFDSVCKKRHEANTTYLKARTRNLEIMAALIANLLQTCPSNIPYCCHPYKWPGSNWYTRTVAAFYHSVHFKHTDDKHHDAGHPHSCQYLSVRVGVRNCAYWTMSRRT